MKIVDKKVSGDGSIKFLWQIEENFYIENLLVRGENQETFCIASQIGCSQRCKFCFNGDHKFVRNLSAEEIITQIQVLDEYSDSFNAPIYFASVGEPLNNLSTIETVSSLIGSRESWIISSGPKSWTTRTPKLPFKMNIQLSIHFLDNKKRKTFMPNSEPANISASHLKKLSEKSDSKLHGRYILFKGTNDAQTDLDSPHKI